MTVTWKTEGPTDLMALLSADPSVDAFTTANGASEKPVEWIIKLCEGKTVYVVHDADKPGQEGATWIGEPDGRRRPGWCPSLAKSANEVRNVKLPFVVELTKGQDLRDFFNGGGTLDDLIDLAESAEVFGESESESAKDFINEKEEDPHRLARINIKQYEDGHSGRLVFWRNEWWKWKGGAYRRIEREDLRSKVNGAIRNEFVRCWRQRQLMGGSDAEKPVRSVNPSIVTSTIEAMQSIARISWSIEMQTSISERRHKNYIAMQNGILDLDAVFASKEPEEFLLPHSSDWFSTIKLDYAFERDADCPLWEEYLNRTFEGDKERIQLAQEWAGYLLVPGNPQQKFLAMEGDGGNGKTVFLTALMAMIGQQNTSSIPLEKFGGRFDLYNTVGKMVNICGDVGEIDQVAEGHLKDFTGGGVMSFDRKNIAPIECVPTAKLMMSWNNRPRFRDRSQGLWRRMLLLPFNRPVPEEEKIPGMVSKEWWIDQGEVCGILLWAIRGLWRLNRNGRFSIPKASHDAINDYKEETNPTLDFLNNQLTMEEATENEWIRCEWLYQIYRHWAERTGHLPLGDRQFGKEFRRVYKDCSRERLSFNGRPWVYKKIKFQSDEIFGKSTSEF